MAKTYFEYDLYGDIKTLLVAEKKRLLSEADCYAAAAEIISKIIAESEEMPHEKIWHFLSDYDIRQKDSEYAVVQIGKVEDIITEIQKPFG